MLIYNFREVYMSKHIKEHSDVSLMYLRLVCVGLFFSKKKER